MSREWEKWIYVCVCVCNLILLTLTTKNMQQLFVTCNKTRTFNINGKNIKACQEDANKREDDNDLQCPHLPFTFEGT